MPNKTEPILKFIIIAPSHKTCVAIAKNIVYIRTWSGEN
jgi:hypothetical protein